MPAQPAYLVYCIAENDDGASANRKADPESRMAAVEEIRYGDISAIAGRVAVERGKEAAKEQQRWLLDYQQGNLAFFQHRTLLPVSFGTIVSHREEVEDFLAASYTDIKTVLDRMRGKAEFVVQLSWDLKAILEEIHRKQLGTRETKDRVEIGRALFEAAQRKRKRISESAHLKLSAVSLESSEAKNTDDSMIMNRSYLIERTAEASFDQVMAELGRKNPSYLHFKYMGPLPPYNFVSLEFTRGNAGLIDSARKALGVGERASFEEIRAAYRTQSMQYHPDRNPDDLNAQERFREITEAYKILRMYCLGVGQPKQNTQYNLAEDEVSRAFLVSEKKGFL